MKKILYLFCAAAVIFAGCKKEETPGEGGNGGNGDGGSNIEYPAPTPNTAYTIECTNAIEGSTWKSGDAIGLCSATKGVTANNLKCVVDPSSVGNAAGLFTTPKLNLIAGENLFVAYAPHSAELLVYNNQIYNVTIPNSQSVTAGEIPNLFSWGTFKGIPVVQEKFTATIAPLSAILKVSVSTTELAGFSVKSLSVSGLNGTEKLSGVYNIDLNTGTLAANEEFLLVNANVKNPSALVSGTAQDYYIQVAPGSYDGLYVTIVVTKTVDDVEETYTLIKKVSALELKAGTVTNVSASGLTSTTCEAEWYAADDTRLFPEGAWGYGQANTFLIQCKSGSTYTNATYTPDSSIPGEVTIDIRARGNLAKVQDPKGATFEWYQFNGKTYAPRTTDYASSNIDPTQFTYEYDGEYTVKVKNTGAFAGAPILVMKKGGKILWSWTFWNIAADGTKLQAVDVQGTPYKIANMDIGQATTQFSTWTKNQNSASAAGPDLVLRTICFYQHGRPIPTFWTSYWSVNGNIPVIFGPVSLDDAIANPVGQILKETPGEGMGPWLNEIQQKIWGGSDKNDASVAEKTIYDPCPQGWQVPPPAVAVALAANAPTAHDMTGAVGVKFPKSTGDVVYLTAGYINGKIDTNGRLQSMGGGQVGTASACKYGILWTSMCGADQGHALYINNSVAGLSNTRKGTFNRTISAPVRCIKELN